MQPISPIFASILPRSMNTSDRHLIYQPTTTGSMGTTYIPALQNRKVGQSQKKIERKSVEKNRRDRISQAVKEIHHLVDNVDPTKSRMTHYNKTETADVLERAIDRLRKTSGNDESSVYSQASPSNTNSPNGRIKTLFSGFDVCETALLHELGVVMTALGVGNSGSLAVAASSKGELNCELDPSKLSGPHLFQLFAVLLRRLSQHRFELQHRLVSEGFPPATESVNSQGTLGMNSTPNSSTSTTSMELSPLELHQPSLAQTDTTAILRLLGHTATCPSISIMNLLRKQMCATLATPTQRPTNFSSPTLLCDAAAKPLELVTRSRASIVPSQPAVESPFGCVWRPW